jgi:Carboxypeptidase regulatory-like domain
MKRREYAAWLALCSTVLAPLCSARAQVGRRELIGFVRDPIGRPIDGAAVDVAGIIARTDSSGRFRLWTANVDTITISIRRFGFTAIEAQIAARAGRWDTVMVEMEGNAQRLDAVHVSEAASKRANGLRDFDERKARGLGVFVTREDIASRNTSRPSDVLLGRRGVHLVKLRSGYYGVRFSAYSRKPGCAPDVWLDGQRARGMEVDDLLTSDIEAMELYENWSTAPSEFAPQGGRDLPCGTIIVWTRPPPPKK